MDKIRVLILDEHPSVRRALAELLGSSSRIEVLATAKDLNEGLVCLSTQRVDVVVLGLKSQSGLGGSLPLDERLRAIAGRSRGLLVLATFADDEEREAAFRAGARRYLVKDIDSARLIAEIEAVAAEPSAGDAPMAI